MQKSNVIMIVADQMRCDSMHHMGNQASITPNIDLLAKEGISFQNAYCQNPVCVPSRCSFLSGLYPHTTGHRTMHYLQRDYENNLFKEMKKQGYEVIWIGRNHLLIPGIAKDSYCDEFYNGVDEIIHMEDIEKYTYKQASYTTPDMMKDSSIYSFYHGKLQQEDAKQTFDWNCIHSALTYLDNKDKKSNKPFFIYISLIFPHPPYECEEPWFSSIDRNALPERRMDIERLNKPEMLKQIHLKQNLKGWSESQFNELRATYLAMVSRFDHQVGLITEKLKEHALYDETNIIVFSDHGDYTGDYGIVEKVQNCFEDPVCNVPLIIKPTKDMASVGVCDEIVELLDIPATVADIAGFKLSYTQFGESLMGFFTGQKRSKTIAICEGGRLHGEEQAMELGHGKKSPYWPRLSTQAKESSEHTKAVMARFQNFKYVLRLYESDEFYDLENDPHECHNIIQNISYKNLIDELRYKLLCRLFETSDVVPVQEDKKLNW